MALSTPRYRRIQTPTSRCQRRLSRDDFGNGPPSFNRVVERSTDRTNHRKIMPTLETTQAHQSKLYYEFSHLYDRVFASVFADRIHRVIESLQIPPGSSVLEVGVGTGFSIEAYPSECEVIGIDLAPEMLEKAREKIAEQGLNHISVAEMNALELEFDDNSFDFTTGFHVISVVPDAHRFLSEVIRVTKPGGTIVLINHFRSRHRILSALDTMIEPITRRLGWHTLDLHEVLQDAPLKIERQYKTSPRSLFTILVARNEKAPTPSATHD